MIEILLFIIIAQLGFLTLIAGGVIGIEIYFMFLNHRQMQAAKKLTLIPREDLLKMMEPPGSPVNSTSAKLENHGIYA